MVKQLVNSQASIQIERQLPPQEQDITQDEQHHHHEIINSNAYDPGPTNYAGSTHWTAILDDLHDLSALLRASPERQNAESQRPTLQTGNEPLFGASSGFSLPGIISEFLPAKADIDRLLSLHFQGPIFIIPILHMRQFQRQYRAFWVEPSEVKPL